MFHDRTYSLLGIAAGHEPAPLLSRVPASLREWYSHPDAVAVASRQDRLRPPSELEVVAGSGRELLVFMDEDQGVCRWAVALDGTDDPEVFVSIEEAPYRRYADTFSDHIFCAVWDWLNGSSYAASAQAGPLAADDLAVLRRALRALPSTWNWPGAENYRFADVGLRLRLWSAPDQCDWYLFGDSAEAFLRGARLIAPLSDLRTLLYPLDDKSKMLLRRM